MRDQNLWFTQANAIAKRLEPAQQALAIEMTKGTGMYPRDLLIGQQAGGIYEIVEADGSIPEYRRYFRETVVFQGVYTHLTLDQFLAVGGTRIVIWTLPVIDTAGFWNAGSPTLFTIPAGINVVELVASWRATGTAVSFNQYLFILKNGVVASTSAIESDVVPGATTATGPIDVIEGDTFSVAIRPFSNITMAAGIRSRFTLNVLDAD